ncbi:MAG: hypothetical protein AMXMBFR53_04220 [Gemmatimonadota bacterium]
MQLHGRSSELGQLRTAYDRGEASSGWVVGLPGSGKTALVRAAAADFAALYHRAPPLSEPQQRSALAGTLRAGGWDTGTEVGGEEPPGWDALFAALVAGAPPGRATVLVVDDAHRWMESRARFAQPLDRALAAARAAGRAVHVTLVAPETPGPRDAEAPGPFPLHVRPLPFRSAASLLPGATPGEKLRAWAVFGGLPGVLRLLDPSASVGTNVRRLVLADGAPLRDAPLALLERLFQTPTRYAAILAALAPGEGDWGVVHAGVPDLSASGQAGPYLKRLEEVGLVEVRRSLDASPRTRSRRYRVTDPFVSFWFRFVLPHRHRLAGPEPEALYAQAVRPGLDTQVDTLLPQAWRDFMTHDASVRLGAGARECGSLWGSGYEIPVAGVLSTGAPFYGLSAYAEEGEGASPLARLNADIRETRYGFGRERRLRILFHRGEVPLALQREVARRDDTVLLGVDALLGSEE